MNGGILLIGIVIVICILLNRMLERIPIPSLLIFLLLGICFGENGLFRIVFNDYASVNLISSTCLIFIMFYGGFGTNLKAAQPVIVRSAILSTLGVVGTAGAVGTFARFALGLPWIESLLIGSVISSTDAASVFNILRSRQLALKDHADSMLELESGSNDPVSYMLTTVLVGLLSGEQVLILPVLFTQILVGVISGLLIGRLSDWMLRRDLFISQQSRTIFLFGVMLLSYAVPAILGGNGYLSVYLCGILLGNTRLSHKKYFVHFIEVVTGVAQVIIFFLLGLLVTPSQLPSVLFPALMIMAFLTLVGRPVVCALLLRPFRVSIRQIGVVSFAGLRGAASIVFAISVVLSGVQTRYDIFNLVFCVVLLSISIQGTLLPWVADRLSMIDQKADVGKTFTDYQEEGEIGFFKLHLNNGHPWCGRTLSELPLSDELLVVLIVRKEGNIVPNGGTKLCTGDLLVIAAPSFEDRANMRMHELVIDYTSKMANQPIAHCALKNQLVALIRRGDCTLIPTGQTVVLPGDILILMDSIEKKN